MVATWEGAADMRLFVRGQPATERQYRYAAERDAAMWDGIWERITDTSRDLVDPHTAHAESARARGRGYLLLCGRFTEAA